MAKLVAAAEDEVLLPAREKATGFATTAAGGDARDGGSTDGLALVGVGDEASAAGRFAWPPAGPIEGDLKRGRVLGKRRSTTAATRSSSAAFLAAVDAAERDGEGTGLGRRAGGTTTGAATVVGAGLVVRDEAAVVDAARRRGEGERTTRLEAEETVLD